MGDGGFLLLWIPTGILILLGSGGLLLPRRAGSHGPGTYAGILYGSPVSWDFYNMWKSMRESDGVGSVGGPAGRPGPGLGMLKETGRPEPMRDFYLLGVFPARHI